MALKIVSTLFIVAGIVTAALVRPLLKAIGEKQKFFFWLKIFVLLLLISIALGVASWLLGFPVN